MTGRLQNKKIAILATDGFEQSELFEPKRLLEEQGAVTKIISLNSGAITGWSKGNWGKSIAVDFKVEDISPDEFDALVLPGGVMNPDKLRADQTAVTFVKSFGMAGKPIGAICHAPWILIDAELVNGRTMTSWPSLKTDLRNAGAEWVDREVVTDQGLVTSRKPDDIPAFVGKLIEEIQEGPHPRRFSRAQPDSSIRH